jgi:phosphoenolpyruvate carboxylase
MAVGSWVGGDRDGNPFVTAEMLEAAFRRQAEVALDHHLGRSAFARGRAAAFRAAHQGHTGPRGARQRIPGPLAAPPDEPYRRALTGVYARLFATAQDLGLRLTHRAAVGGAPPYASVGEFTAALDVIDASLRAGGGQLLADGRLRMLRKAASAFGFHLATVDLRQNSEIHEEVIEELLREANVAPRYRELDESRGASCCSPSSASHARCDPPSATIRSSRAASSRS